MCIAVCSVDGCPQPAPPPSLSHASPPLHALLLLNELGFLMSGPSCVLSAVGQVSGQSVRCKLYRMSHHALVTPVQKNGSSDLVENYRPISVLPVVVKVLERLVHRQLYACLQEKTLLHSSQFGFRPGYSTQDVLVSLVDEWREALDDDKLVGTIFMHLSKAFDMVDHSILLRKLAKFGIGGDELRWFLGYLRDRKQRVCVSEAASKWTTIHRGVPQGSILGPRLFILYVNDLPLTIPSSNVRQYADDTTVSVVRADKRDLEQCLETDLKAMDTWVKANKLNLNVQKTQLLVLSRRRREQETMEVQVVVDGKELKRSSVV